MKNALSLVHWYIGTLVHYFTLQFNSKFWYTVKIVAIKIYRRIIQGPKFANMMEILRSGLPLGPSAFRDVRDGIFIRQNDYYKKCLYTDLLWVQASGSYSYLHLRDRSHIIVALRLGMVEHCLPDSHFVRIHRSYVVSLFDIDTFVGNSLRIGDNWFPIGRLYRTEVLALLNILNYVCDLSEDSGDN